MNISCFKREEKPKYTEKQTEKAKNLCKNLLTYYTDRNARWFWTMKYTLHLMAQTWWETTTTTRITSQIVHILFVELRWKGEVYGKCPFIREHH